jgi:CarD family transcriptional regulator
MYKIGDYVIHKRYVCKIVNIREKFFNDIDYFVLENIIDPSLSIMVPKNKESILKPIMTKKEIEELLKKIPSIPVIDLKDEKSIENSYRELINTGEKEDLIKIIKSAYIRNQERVKLGKKAGEKDTSYLEMAENLLYNECAVSLGISLSEAKEYIIKKVEEYDKKSNQ